MKIRLLLVVVVVSSCVHRTKPITEHKKLFSIDKRDTVLIDLHISKNQFVGNYKLNGPGNYIVKGELSGEVRGDTLFGSLYYTPFQWKYKKRRAFALLRKGDNYVQGVGLEYVYMNIPYFTSEALKFEGILFKEIP